MKMEIGVGSRLAYRVITPFVGTLGAGIPLPTTSTDRRRPYPGRVSLITSYWDPANFIKTRALLALKEHGFQMILPPIYSELTRRKRVIRYDFPVGLKLRPLHEPRDGLLTCPRSRLWPLAYSLLSFCVNGTERGPRHTRISEDFESKCTRY